MLRLLTNLASNPSLAFELGYMSLAANLLALVPPIFVMVVLNKYISYGVDATLITLTSGATISIICEYFFRRARYRSARALSVGVDSEVDERVIKKLTEVKLGYLNQIHSSVFRSVLGSVDQIRQTYSPTNICAAYDAPFAIIFLIALYFISPLICYLTILIIIILGTVVLTQLLGLRALVKNINATNILKSQISSEVIKFSETVRVFDQEGYLSKKWLLSCKKIEALQSNNLDRQNRTQTLIRSISGILTVIVISVGAVLVVKEQLDVGAMIGANILAARALGPIIQILQQVEGWIAAEQAHKTLVDFDRLPVEKLVGTELTRYSGDLVFRDVAFNYPSSDISLIENLTFSLKPGNILCVFGGNGSGKSTLAKMIAGLIEPKVGSISIDGINLKQLSMNWWRKQIMYFPQEPDFFDGSIRENFLTYKADVTDDEIRKLFKSVGLSEFIDKTVGGLDQIINNSSVNLSLGIRRRIALARALMSDGKVVILDEPTVGIDALGISKVYEIMNEISSKNKTMIVFSRDREILKGAQHFIDLGDAPNCIMRSIQVQ